MYYNRSSSSIGKVLLLIGIVIAQGGESSSGMVIGFMSCYAILQSCILVPSIGLPVKNRSLTTYLIGETLLMVSAGFVGPVILPHKYINMFVIFLLAHTSACQLECLASNRSLLRWVDGVRVCLVLGTTAVGGTLVVYCPAPLIPELALALFCGEIVGILVAITCNILSYFAFWYESLFMYVLK